MLAIAFCSNSLYSSRIAQSCALQFLTVSRSLLTLEGAGSCPSAGASIYTSEVPARPGDAEHRAALGELHGGRPGRPDRVAGSLAG